MWSDQHRSVVMITSSDPNKGSSHGIGFIVFCDEQSTFVVTCAHVIHVVGGREVVLVNNEPAQVIASGFEQDDIDLAVLRINKKRDDIPLSLSVISQEESSFTMPTFRRILKDRQLLFHTLSGTVRKYTGVGPDTRHLVKTFDLSLSYDDELKDGYSGSPIIVQNKVVGVILMREGEKKGRAISIEYLPHIWQEIPYALFTYDFPYLFLSTTKNARRLGKLFSILNALEFSKDELKIWYKNSIPDDILGTHKWLIPWDKEKDTLVLEVLEKLEDAFPSEIGLPPLLKFTEQLRFYTIMHKKEHLNEVETWIDEYIYNYNIDLQPIRTYRKEHAKKQLSPKKYTIDTETPTTPQLSLLIQLERQTGSKAFFLKAWVRNGTDNLIPLPLHTESRIFDKPYTAKTIPPLLNMLVNDVLEYEAIEWAYKPFLRIEFFLPCELFDENVDAWYINEKDKQPLGIKYQVIIRSSEREKMDEAIWRKKWSTLQDLSVSPLNHTHCFEQPLQEHKHIPPYTRISAHLIDTAILCCCMTLPPGNIVSSRHKKDIFRAIITSGTPIALWTRKLPEDATKITEYQTTLRLLVHDTFLKLPDRVLQQRRAALQGGEKDHPGYHLTLFWDEWDEPRGLPPKPKKFQEIRRGR